MTRILFLLAALTVPASAHADAVIDQFGHSWAVCAPYACRDGVADVAGGTVTAIISDTHGGVIKRDNNSGPAFCGRWVHLGDSWTPTRWMALPLGFIDQMKCR